MRGRGAPGAAGVVQEGVEEISRALGCLQAEYGVLEDTLIQGSVLHFGVYCTGHCLELQEYVLVAQGKLFIASLQNFTWLDSCLVTIPGSRNSQYIATLHIPISACSHFVSIIT